MQCPESTQNGANSSGYATFYSLYNTYEDIHGYLATTVCCVGVLTDIAYIFVLTRPRMQSVINVLLTCIAVCDSILMLSCIAYLAHSRLAPQHCRTLNWMRYSLFYAHLSVTLRSVSMWLGAAMGIVRCSVLTLQHKFAPVPRKAQGIALRILLLVCTFVLVCNIPVYMLYEVDVSEETHPNCSHPEYDLMITSVAQRHECALLVITHWMNAVVHKLLPCIVVCVCVGILLHCLRKNYQRRQSACQLRDRLATPPTTTLVVILIVILFAELPHAVVSILSALDKDFSIHVYRNVGDVLDLVSLLNCIVTFTLYCSTSRSFRETLLEKFRLYQPALQTLTDIAVNSAVMVRMPRNDNASGESGHKRSTLRVRGLDLAGMDTSCATEDKA